MFLGKLLPSLWRTCKPSARCCTVCLLHDELIASEEDLDGSLVHVFSKPCSRGAAGADRQASPKHLPDSSHSCGLGNSGLWSLLMPV